MGDVMDGPWRLFDYDPVTGRSVWVLHEDGKMHFRIDYPVDGLIRQNHEARAASAHSRFGDFVRVASTPINIWQQSGMAEAHQQQDKKFMGRFFNDPDNRAWRTKEGQV